MRSDGAFDFGRAPFGAVPPAAPDGAVAPKGECVGNCTFLAFEPFFVFGVGGVYYDFGTGFYVGWDHDADAVF